MYYVYFIQRAKRGSIKIWLSKNPEKRLKTLQTGNHSKLNLIAKFPFDSRREAFALENDFHRKFADYKKEGEWFNRVILRRMKEESKDVLKCFDTLYLGLKKHEKSAEVTLAELNFKLDLIIEHLGIKNA